MKGVSKSCRKAENGYKLGNIMSLSYVIMIIVST